MRKFANYFKLYFSSSNILHHFISVVGLGMLLIWNMETRLIFDLTSKGISTKATVNWVDKVVSSNSNTPDTYYHISFFVLETLPDSTQLFNKKMHFGRLLHLQGDYLEEGEEIQILYDPQNPDRIIFDLPLPQHMARVRVWGLLLMAAILLIGGQVFIVLNMMGKQF